MNFNFTTEAGAHPAEAAVPLAALAAGATGRIAGLEIDDSHDLERLEVMGLCPGRTVEVVKCGDPMIVRVLGTRIGLAAVLAGRIAVRPHERSDRR
jgi:Fe2+ transport system protein FeoA